MSSETLVAFAAAAVDNYDARRRPKSLLSTSMTSSAPGTTKRRGKGKGLYMGEEEGGNGSERPCQEIGRKKRMREAMPNKTKRKMKMKRRMSGNNASYKLNTEPKAGSHYREWK